MVILQKLLSISIHAPARGATAWMRCGESCVPYFNPRSRTGSDMLYKMVFLVLLLFQSTLPHGERQVL